MREHAQRGVDVIKVMASGGMMTAGADVRGAQFSPAELRVLVTEAHRHGLPVTAHAHALDAIVDAVAAGVDGIEHCTFFTADGVHAPDDVVSAIVARRIAVGATVGLVPVEGAVRLHRRDAGIGAGRRPLRPAVRGRPGLNVPIRTRSPP